MKILQIHNEYQFKGGEDNVVEAERKLLLSMGNEVFSIIAHNKSIKHLFSERRRFYAELNAILVNNIIDVAHIHNVYHIIGNDIYELLALKNIPIIQTLHNFRFLCPAGLFMDNQHQICEKCSDGNFISCTLKKCYQKSYVKSLGMSILAKNGRNAVLKYVDKFVVLNSFSRDKFIVSGFDKEKMVVKSNFIPEIQLTSSNYQFILYIGRLSPEKGVETLIEAFSNLNYHLKVAGSGEEDYVKKLKKLAEKNSNIEFVGYIDGAEKERLIKNSKFLIITSLCYENFPISILEAYSHGKPVIASNIGGLPFIVKDKETGLLFEAGNAEDLKKAVNNMIENDDFIALGKKGYEYYKENFTEKQNYHQLIDIYEKAIAAKKLKNDKSNTHNY